MKISIKGYIASKKSELFYDCADRFALSKDSNKFAISDGVSKSFFPKIWADILVNKFVTSEEFDDDIFILECQNDWLDEITEIVKAPSTKYYTKNAFNRREPALATFVGLHFYKKGKKWHWKANALGDSFLFFLPKKYENFNKSLISLSSKQTPITFDNFPDYLTSIGNQHKGTKKTLDAKLEEGTFYLMTDALAEWFLNEKELAINKINVWQNQQDFERFIAEERFQNKLENDDSTILIIELKKGISNKIKYTNIDVSDIQKLILKQQKESHEIKKKEIENQEVKGVLSEKLEVGEINEQKIFSNEVETTNDESEEVIATEKPSDEAQITNNENEEVVSANEKPSDKAETTNDKSEEVITTENLSNETQTKNDESEEAITTENLSNETQTKNDESEEVVTTEKPSNETQTTNNESEEVIATEKKKINNITKNITDKF